MIAIENLYKSFGKNEVLKGINLKFSEPRITAILGPNGSGKTTLIKCLLGMVIPDQGRITVNGKSIKKEWTYREKIDYLPQIARFPENLKVIELINMVKDIRSAEANDQELIRLFELELFLQKRLGSLSGGTRQKVNLVLAFMYDSPIMVLDEPTVGLDPLAKIALKELILRESAKGKFILFTTHIMSLVEELADEVVFLLEGHVHFRGSLDQLKEEQGAINAERAIANMLHQTNATGITIS